MSGFVPPPDPPACIVRGDDAVDIDLFASASAALPSVGFFGFRHWEVLDLPAGPDVRVRVRTRNATPGVRFDGWVTAGDLPIHSTRSLPISTWRLSISAGTPLHVFAQGASIDVAPSDSSLLVRARASCEDLALGALAPSPFTNATTWKTFARTATSVQLFDGPNGSSLGTFAFADEPDADPWGVVETKGTFAHVILERGVHVDAWVQLAGLVPWNDAAPTPFFTCGLEGLAVVDKSVGRRVKKDVDVLLDPDGPKVGVVEAGAEIVLGPPKKGYAEIRERTRTFAAPVGHQLVVRTGDLSRFASFLPAGLLLASPPGSGGSTLGSAQQRKPVE